MIGKAEFAAGLTAVGIAVRQAPDPATLAVYHDVLGHTTDAEEWGRFIRWGLDAGRWAWFPKLADLQDALREFRGGRPILAEATEAYERVLQSGCYTAEGTSWTYRAVMDRCGEAAAMAFLAAGGSSAFASTWDEAKRRERFIAEYAESVREDPDSRLLPVGPTRELPPAREDFTRDEAKAFVKQIAARAGR